MNSVNISRIKKRLYLVPSLVVSIWLMADACTLRHTIEPSDKPLVVNLNVKIDHEIRVKIRDQNQDILNLEQEYLKEKKEKGKE